jgi:cardiolipin synthase
MHGLLYIIGATLSWILIALTIIHVIMDNRQPAKTMAWALVIFFVPIVGIILYLFFGVNHRRERLVSQRSLDQLSKRSMLSFVEQHDFRVPDHYRQLVDLFVNQSMSLPFKDNTVDIMTDGYAFFPELLKDIRQAHHHIHIDMYIIEDDALGRLVADALGEKAKEGVEVRVIYDDVGCWKVDRSFFESMRRNGVEVVPYLPVHFPTFTSKANYRNHRKLIVIDGQVGYIGGMNIALRYVKGTGTQAWRDTMIEVTGNGVFGLQRAFLVDWYFADRTQISNRQYYPKDDHPVATANCIVQTVTSGPDTRYPEIMQGYVQMILSARRYVYIETPYFLPTEPVMFALKTAAVAGVDVRILVPMRSDARLVELAGRSYLREAAQSGVRVSLYTAGFLHSKLIVCDDTVCSCGSTNVDFRSFENNFESNIFIYDETVTRQLREVFLTDEGYAMRWEDLPSRVAPKFHKRLLESLVRLMSPLM